MDVPCIEGPRMEASTAQGAGERVPSGTMAHVRLPAVVLRALERAVRLLVPAQRPWQNLQLNMGGRDTSCTLLEADDGV